VVVGRVGGFGAGCCAHLRVTLPPVAKRMGGTAGVSLSHLWHRLRPSPNRSFLLHHRIRPGSSLLSHRIWGHEASGAKAGDAEGDSARPRRQLPTGLLGILFFSCGSLGEMEWVGPTSRHAKAVALPAEPWLCQRHSLTHFLGVEKSSPNIL
jgi:hypothetical protein